jgi:hypothetical protein
MFKRFLKSYPNGKIDYNGMSILMLQAQSKSGCYATVSSSVHFVTSHYHLHRSYISISSFPLVYWFDSYLISLSVFSLLSSSLAKE